MLMNQHCKFPSIMLQLKRVFQVFTWRPSGFQRTFLSRAGVELNVFWGLFFKVRMTPHGSSLKALTRFLSCQPTCGTQEHQANKMVFLTIPPGSRLSEYNSEILKSKICLLYSVCNMTKDNWQE